jgi:hypothetical protein
MLFLHPNGPVGNASKPCLVPNARQVLCLRRRGEPVYLSDHEILRFWQSPTLARLAVVEWQAP